MAQAKIFVVEDENIVSMDIRFSLGQLGYEIAGYAVSGEEALRKIGDARPDLVLMDIHLKGEMTGIEAAREIRSRYSLPIVFLTAFADQDTLAQAQLAEPFGYILKPFDERELNSVITISLYKHRVDQNVRNLQERYRAIAEDMPALVCRFLPEGTLTFVNRQYCTYFGKTAEDLIGANFFQFIPPDERSWVELHYRNLSIENPVVTYEHQVQAPNGSIRWQRWTDRALYDEKGELIEFQSVGEDVTERRMADDALRQSEAKFRNVVTQSRDGIVLTDEEGTVIEWNQAMEAISGLEAQRVVGKPVWEIQVRLAPTEENSAERQQKLQMLVTSALRAGEAPWMGRVLETEFIHPDGSHRFIQSVAFPVRTGRGFMIGGILRDITDRRKAEEKMHLQGAALDATVNAIVITDINGTITWVNPAFTLLTGYTAQEAIGQNPRLLKSGRHPPSFYEGLWQAILSGSPWQGEVINRRKDGSEYFEEMTVTPIRDSRGNIAHFIAVKQDITQRKQAENSLARRLEFEKALAEISANFVQQSDFAQAIGFALHRLGVLKNVDRVSLYLANPDQSQVEFVSQWCASEARPEPMELKNIPLADHPWFLTVLNAGAILSIDDIASLPLEAETSRKLIDLAGLQAVQIVPLIIQEKAAGVLVFGSETPRSWDEEDKALLHTLSGVLSSTIKKARAEEAERHARHENIRLYQEALQLSRTDPLTGLYNRRYFFELVQKEIERLRRFQHGFSLIILDVDHFKNVNDTYGHLAGDQALREIARLLKSVTRSIDSVGRFGGEEFIVLLPETNLYEALKVAERIRLAIAEMSLLINDAAIRCTVSLGITYTQDGDIAIDALLSQVDNALYKAKGAGRNRAEYWNADRQLA